MIEYTEKLHAERLLHMLEKEKPCVCCPKIRKFRMNTYCNNYDEYIIVPVEEEQEVCRICKTFIGLEISSPCPCYAFQDFAKYHYFDKTEKQSQQEAIKRTWIALEEKGYLDYEDNTCNPSDD